MALHQYACGITVMIILLSRGINSEPACARSLITSGILEVQDASPGTWPWHVTLTDRGRVFCQGSLITDEWVLTAASCSLRSYLSGAVLNLGANNQSRFGEVTRRVDSIVCHQDYGSHYDNGENDICLVKLSAPVNFTDYIQPVCLASEDSTFYDGTASWVAGFIGTGYYGPTFHEVDVSVFGNNKCSCIYRNYYYQSFNPITDNMICGGIENGLNPVNYQKQGAALVTKKASIWVQSGIVSYVNDYYLGRPTVYTRVSQYQKWISSQAAAGPSSIHGSGCVAAVPVAVPVAVPMARCGFLAANKWPAAGTTGHSGGSICQRRAPSATPGAACWLRAPLATPGAASAGSGHHGPLRSHVGSRLSGHGHYAATMMTVRLSCQ
ncbi:PREDICTED: chymotrypsin-like protease CTRL-1 [Cyprinodon variegatus]|uniref:chymotrypsin-like protease CTRL-1 n=1 Tax=Cyprinodon variegatus TaxID=28743 RepID=UPI00074265B5|nr:PREDICTED: chymotrypsin-like protease CTRL-1 [Cyprinodon variegatus]